jgi:hypothetical protein
MDIGFTFFGNGLNNQYMGLGIVNKSSWRCIDFPKDFLITRQTFSVLRSGIAEAFRALILIPR